MMNNCNELLEQAESLKKELNNGRNGLSSDGSGKGEWVSSRTMLQDVYRQLLITNLEYALDKKIEQELWNFVFKNHITALQQQVKDKSNTFRSEAQCQLTSFLDAASGFYIQLIDELCQAFNINIPYRINSSKLVFLKDTKSVNCKSIAQPERPSCQYMCQHCLVHLGDIARYRNQTKQAETYYRYAAQLVPSNGQPYNQLAILASVSGDVLSTAFYYCRSLAVKCPFPGSDTNLRRQLAKIMAGDEPRHTKISTSELFKYCLKFHACIYLKQNEADLNGMVEKLSGYVRAHLRAGSLPKQQMIYMTFLNLFSLHHLSPNGVDSSGNPVTLPVEGSEGKAMNGDADTASKPNETELVSWSALLTFTMHMLGGLLACVPAHSDDIVDLEHHALPSIKLTLDWLVSNFSTLHRPEVAQNSRVWPRLAKVLNALGNQDKANNMGNLHLPEDLEVRGFVGLKNALSKLDFMSGIGSGVPANMEHSCRCYRLYQVGIAIAGVNSDLLSYCEENNGTVFSSSISPSPQHASKTNGLEEESEEEDEEETEDEVESFTSSPNQNDRASKDNVPPLKPALDDVKRAPRTKGVLKVMSDEHSSNRKRNRAPRMQNVGVQIKPEHKLKVIKEEEGGGHADNLVATAESESGRSNSESSQGDISPSAMTHTRSGHRVTFAQQVSPIQYPHDDSPSPVGPGYAEQGNMMIGGIPGFSKSTSNMNQPPYMPSMHNIMQMGPIYRQPPPTNPILSAPYVRRPVGPYHYQQNLLTRPPMQIPSYQHMHPTNPPPHPAELPKPVFQTSLYSQGGAADNIRAPPHQGQLNQINSESNLEQILKTSRPTDLSYLHHQQLHSNPRYNLSNLSPSAHETNLAQRLSCPTMAAQFPNRPNMNASVIQQLRLQEMSLANEMGNDLNMGVMTSDPSSVPPAYHPQNAVKFNYQNQGLDYSSFVNAKQRQAQQQLQINARSQAGVHPNVAEVLSSRQDGDMARLGQEMNVNYFQGVAAGGSNNTSSTSSPTPGSLNQLNNGPNVSTSPQATGISAMSYKGLGTGLSSMLIDRSSQNVELEGMRRQNPHGNVQQPHHTNLGFVGSPSQKVTPSALGRYLKMDLPQNDNQFHKEALFRGPPVSNAHITDDLRSRSTQAGQTFGLPPQQDRVKALFDERANIEMPKSTLDSVQSTPPVSQQPSAFPDALLSKEDKDSYELFPANDRLWESRNQLGLSLGSIGSERAAAQQSSHRYSPWGGAQQMQGPTYPERTELPRTSENMPSQSFWSTPMVTSGPSALEQLIRHQQSVSRDKSPP